MRYSRQANIRENPFNLRANFRNLYIFAHNSKNMTKELLTVFIGGGVRLYSVCL